MAGRLAAVAADTGLAGWHGVIHSFELVEQYWVLTDDYNDVLQRN